MYMYRGHVVTTSQLKAQTPIAWHSNEQIKGVRHTFKTAERIPTKVIQILLRAPSHGKKKRPIDPR